MSARRRSRFTRTAGWLIASLAAASCSSSTPERNVVAPASAVVTEPACQFTEQRGGDLQTVVTAAQAFRDSLQPMLRARLVHSLTKESAIQWSNWPVALVPRAGVAFGELNAEQLRLAQRVMEAAAGNCALRAFEGNRASDAVGHKGIPYIDPGLHYVSFNAQPSATAPWMLMMGGHHMAFNIVFNGKEPGATPMLVGTDPAIFVDSKGAVRFPMRYQSEKLTAMTGALTAYPEAKLEGVYTDLTKSVVGFGEIANRAPSQAQAPAGPQGQAGAPASDRPPTLLESWLRGESTRFRLEDGRVAGADTAFPRPYPTGTTGRGVRYSSLSAADQAKVREAIRSFVTLSSSQVSAPLLKLYEEPEALAATYVAYSGDPSLTKRAGYVRIDGPRLWIEVSVQASLVGDTTHYHAIWRDKVSDYGGLFKG